MLFLRARYYNPGIGTFLSKDPAEGFIGGESVRWNGYSYVHGNPINYADPSGNLVPLLLLGAVLLGASIGAGIGWELGVNQHGRSIDCIDWGDVVKSAIIGGFTGGALAVAAFVGHFVGITTGVATGLGALLSGLAYTIGVVIHNVAHGKPIFMGWNVESFATSMVTGAMVGGLSQFFLSLPGITLVEKIAWASTVGLSGGAEQVLLTDLLRGEKTFAKPKHFLLTLAGAIGNLTAIIPPFMGYPLAVMFSVATSESVED